jgi:hypothetical protein
MHIKSIDALSLKNRLDQGSVILIDICEPHEHRANILKARGSCRYHGFKPKTSAPLMTKSPCSIVTAAVVPAQMRAS